MSTAERAIEANSAQHAVRGKRMSQRCERRSEPMSEWLSTYVWILDYSGPLCSCGCLAGKGLAEQMGGLEVDMVDWSVG